MGSATANTVSGDADPKTNDVKPRKMEVRKFEVANIITKRRYVAKIVGLGGLVMNPTPDLSVPKTQLKEQKKEDPTEREYRLWKTKIYSRGDGWLIIPAENIHESMKEGASYWGAKIPGEGQKRYTDVFKSAVVCEPVELNCHVDDPRVIPLGKNCNGNPSSGKGSSTVFKIRPMIEPWEGEFAINVFDDRINIDVLATVIQYAGTFKGVCDHRPTYGRYQLEYLREVEL